MDWALSIGIKLYIYIIVNSIALKSGVDCLIADHMVFCLPVYLRVCVYASGTRYTSASHSLNTKKRMWKGELACAFFS